jgi:hypothetical protein
MPAHANSRDTIVHKVKDKSGVISPEYQKGKGYAEAEIHG